MRSTGGVKHKENSTNRTTNRNKNGASGRKGRENDSRDLRFPHESHNISEYVLTQAFGWSVGTIEITTVVGSVRSCALLVCASS